VKIEQDPCNVGPSGQFSRVQAFRRGSETGLEQSLRRLRVGAIRLEVAGEQVPRDGGFLVARVALEHSKGAGWAARLFEGSTVAELPPTVTGFLKQVYAAFPKPADIPVEVAVAAAPAKPAAAIGAVPPAATA